MTSWSEKNITDDVYREKFIDVTNVISEWLKPYDGFASKDILDFGCGEGTMAMSIALKHGARRVVAVDTHGEIDNCTIYSEQQLGLSQLPDNLELYRIDADESLERLGLFDVVYSWSVFEHVSQELIDDRFLKLRRVLRPDGMMFLQTTPLYYSAWGAHLRPFVPQPWCHLLMQHDRLVNELRTKTENREKADHLQWVYETLNKTTAPRLLEAARSAGFEILREYLTYDDNQIPRELTSVFDLDVLRTAQLVFLARAC